MKTYKALSAFEQCALQDLLAELVAALRVQITPRALNWKVTDWDMRDKQARAAIAKAEEACA